MSLHRRRCHIRRGNRLHEAGAGLQLKEAADRAGNRSTWRCRPLGPVFVLPGALEERLEAIADELFASCSLVRDSSATKSWPPSAARPFYRQLRRGSRRLLGVFLGAPVACGRSATPCSSAAGAVPIAGGREVEGAGFRRANIALRVRASGPNRRHCRLSIWRGVADCFRTRYRPDAGNRPRAT